VSRLADALWRAHTGAPAEPESAAVPLEADTAFADLPEETAAWLPPEQPASQRVARVAVASAGVAAVHAAPAGVVSAPASQPDLSSGVQDDAAAWAAAAGNEPLPDAVGATEVPRTFGTRYVDKVVISSETPPLVRETYRRLAAALHHAQAESGIKTILIASAAPQEGKTLTASNLALTFSESYRRRVLLIDADLRRPSMHDVFQVPNVYGLNEALTGDPTRRVSVIALSPYLSLLTAGTPDQDPMSKLTSDRMRHLLDEAAAGFDWVIIDTPPVGVLTDAKLLADMVDGALFVIGAGKTPARVVQRAVEAIGRSRIIGTILNRVETLPAGSSESYYSASYYAKPAETKSAGNA
jgi:capsular exopolysaccharide synthesis family protein